MDETNKTPQDPLQEPGQASKGSEGTTSKKEAKTYTEEEKQRAVSDALATAGRDAKALANQKADLDARQEAINAKQAEIDEQERQRDAAELEAARGNPELMRVYEDKKSQKRVSASIEAQRADIKKQRETLDHDKAEHEAEIKAAKETQREIVIWGVASAKNIDPVRLKNLSVKFNIESKEQVEALAEEIASGKAEPTEPLTPDSNVTSGGQGEPTKAQLEKMSMAQYAAYVAKRDAKK